MGEVDRKSGNRLLWTFICLLLILRAQSCYSSSFKVSMLRVAPPTNTMGSSRPVLDLRPELSSRRRTPTIPEPTPTRLHEGESVEKPSKGIRQWFSDFWTTVWNDLFFQNMNRTSPNKSSTQRTANLFYRVKQSLNNLWFGVTHVLRHYTSIWLLETVGTELVHAPLQLLFRCAADAYPSLYRSFRQWLVSSLITIDKVSFATEAALFRLSIPLCLYSVFTIRMPGSRNKSSHKRSACLLDKSLSNLPRTTVVLEAPIIEEILYRLLFHRVWTILSTSIHRILEWYHAKAVREDSRISNTTEVSIVTYPHQDLWFGLEPWVLSSSILFGIAHLSNWMPLNKKYFFDELAIFLHLVSRKDEHKYPMRFHKDRQILSSVYQSQHALVLSLICFVPVYQHRGLMASIGSHAALNLIGYCIPNCRYMLAIGSALCKLLIFTSLN
jgi:hypothetical protein